MMKITGILLSLLALIGASHIANANHHEAGDAKHGENCAGMSNADFSISGLDADKNNLITIQEYLAGDKNNNEKTFKHVDANGDGVLDVAEQKDIEAVYKAIHLKLMSKTTNM